MQIPPNCFLPWLVIGDIHSWKQAVIMKNLRWRVQRITSLLWFPAINEYNVMVAFASIKKRDRKFTTFFPRLPKHESLFLLYCDPDCEMLFNLPFSLLAESHFPEGHLNQTSNFPPTIFITTSLLKTQLFNCTI